MWVALKRADCDRHLLHSFEWVQWNNAHRHDPYKPRTGRTSRCMNHALAALAVIYSTHRVLVVYISVAHFHLYGLLGTPSRCTMLEVWAVRWPMRVFAVAADGDGALKVWSLTAPCLVYNAAMYTVYVRCGQYGRCMVHTVAGVASAWFIRTQQAHDSKFIFTLTQTHTKHFSWFNFYSIWWPWKGPVYERWLMNGTCALWWHPGHFSSTCAFRAR